MISTRLVVNLLGLVGTILVLAAALAFGYRREPMVPLLVIAFAIAFLLLGMFVSQTQKEEQIVIRVRRAGKPPLRRD